jgi:hypothetical protein
MSGISRKIIYTSGDYQHDQYLGISNKEGKKIEEDANYSAAAVSTAAATAAVISTGIVVRRIVLILIIYHSNRHTVRVLVGAKCKESNDIFADKKLRGIGFENWCEGVLSGGILNTKGAENAEGIGVRN